MKNSLIEKLYPMWLSSQTDLNEVIRWEKSLANNPGMRRQSTMAHVVSVSLVVSIALIILKKYNSKLDDALVQRAYTLHDLPEGFSQKKSDTSAVDKTTNDDLEEYFLFEKNFSHLPREIYFELKKAYLLQYAEENSKIFPEEARVIMDYLSSERRCEVLIFGALQCWEYFFYAFEVKETCSNRELFFSVLKYNIPKLKKYSQLIRGFREEIFTENFEKYARCYLKRHICV